MGEHVGEFHSGLRIPCDFCADIYLTKEELKHHENEVHTTQLTENTNSGGCVRSSIQFAEESNNSTAKRDAEMLRCKFCDKRVFYKKELMKHNKEKHIETLGYCWDYEAGACDFKENCLFKHEKRELNLEIFKCKFCDKNFPSRKELMKHNKAYHLESVSHCWNYEAGTCEFKDNCWFKHENRELYEIRDQKDPEMFQCKFCDDNFLHRKYLMKHNKERQIETLKPCCNFEAGACNLKENCWFKH